MMEIAIRQRFKAGCFSKRGLMMGTLKVRALPRRLKRAIIIMSYF
jgi:hypothetical protein